MEGALYDLSYASTPFSFTVSRKGNLNNATAVFNSTGQRMVFKVEMPPVAVMIHSPTQVVPLTPVACAGPVHRADDSHCSGQQPVWGGGAHCQHRAAAAASWNSLGPLEQGHTGCHC